MKIWERIAFVACVAAVVVNVVSFALTRDVDKLIIAALFVSTIVWNWNARQQSKLIRDYARLVDMRDAALAKWQPIAQHEAKFADMPRVAGKPLPAPEGHPEYRRGVK